MSASVQIGNALDAAADLAAGRAANYLAGLQQRDGHWCAELTADTTLESDYILFQLWLYPPVEGKWQPATRPLIDKAAAAILERQLPDGGLNIYVHGPSEVSASVKAYFALKLAGIAVDDSRMARLRARILELGGIQAANSYVKVNLSLFDLYPRQYCPSIPPEIVLLPLQFLYQMSSWTRAIAVSLSIVHSANPRRPVPEGFHLDELWLPGVSPAFRRDSRHFTWHNTFLAVDSLLKWWERSGIRSVRRKAVQKAAEWMIERLRQADGLGAIYPPMMYSVMALDVLGYPPDDPLRAEALGQFNSLLVDDGERFFFQPCFSPVWDTGIAAYALAQCDAKQQAVRRAADWLLEREVRRKGDWSVKRPNTEPSGWAFEFANEFYPDIDDTAMVLLALQNAASSNPKAQAAAEKRAIDWLLAMQSEDGGWAAFDVDNNWAALNQVPFADHNAMLDPTCPDITGRVLESLCRRGLEGHPAVRRGVAYLLDAQETDGSWYGRWGVNYVYGSFLAMRGLASSGLAGTGDAIAKGARWLRSVENPDGGWGESCVSYDREGFVAAPSCASQTAWALLGLAAAGDRESGAVLRGVEFLLERQRADGTWPETATTGTGFPQVFYLTYGMYRDYFPLLALASFLH